LAPKVSNSKLGLLMLLLSNFRTASTKRIFTHLLTCTNPRAKKCRFDSLTPLRKGLTTFSGGSIFLCLLTSWIHNPNQFLQIQAPTLDLQEIVNQAIALQSRIGWEHLFRGVLSSDWGSFFLRRTAPLLPTSSKQPQNSISHCQTNASNLYTCPVGRSKLHPALELSHSSHLDMGGGPSQLRDCRSIYYPSHTQI
jgi:hypothetical protein